MERTNEFIYASNEAIEEAVRKLDFIERLHLIGEAYEDYMQAYCIGPNRPSLYTGMSDEERLEMDRAINRMHKIHSKYYDPISKNGQTEFHLRGWKIYAEMLIKDVTILMMTYRQILRNTIVVERRLAS